MIHNNAYIDTSQSQWCNVRRTAQNEVLQAITSRIWQWQSGNFVYLCIPEGLTIPKSNKTAQKKKKGDQFERQ